PTGPAAGKFRQPIGLARSLVGVWYVRGMGELTPVQPRERVATLDVLRGFALLGVLVANLYVLYSLRFTLHGEPPGGAADVVARWFMALFVHSRAQTLLTFLFGFG